MGTDRTWEIERDRFSHMCHPPLEMGECVSVVEESRLREAEAERDRAKRSNDGLLDAVERLNETNDRLRTEVEQLQSIAGLPLVESEQAAREAEARVERLETAIERIYRDRRESDKVLGECVSVLPQLARDRARGVLDGGDDGG